MPNAASAAGKRCAPDADRSCSSGADHLARPASRAPPASARNSRCRENHITIIVAKRRARAQRPIVVTQNAGRADSCSVRNTVRVDRVADYAREEHHEVFTTP